MAARAWRSRRRPTARVFDIRIVIGLLFGIYGAVLTVAGLVNVDEETSEAAGFDINLWSGLGMLLVAALFALWARLRPLAMPSSPGETDEPGEPAGEGSPGAERT